jgi:hypothetical protein
MQFGLFLLIGFFLALNDNVALNLFQTHYVIFRVSGLLVLVGTFVFGFHSPKHFWLWPTGIFTGSLLFDLFWLFYLPENSYESRTTLLATVGVLIWAFIFSILVVISHYLFKKLTLSTRVIFLGYTLFVTLFMTLTPNLNNFSPNVENWGLISFCLVYFLLGFIYPRYFLIWFLGAFIGSLFFAILTLITIEPDNDYAGNGLVLLVPLFTGAFTFVLSGLGLLSREIAAKISNLIYPRKN